MPHDKDSNDKDNENTCDTDHVHDENCGHTKQDGKKEEIDSNLNYPFHYHYEHQKLMAEQDDQVITLPPFVQDVTSIDDIAQLKDSPLKWIHVTAGLNESGIPIIADQTLEEALDPILEHKLNIILRVQLMNDFEETETMATILDSLSQIWDEDCPEIIIMADNLIAYGTAEETIPYWHKGLVLDGYFDDETKFEAFIDFAQKNRLSCVLLNQHDVTEERIERLMDLEKPIIVHMTDADPLMAKRMEKWGVDTLISTAAIQFVH